MYAALTAAHGRHDSETGYYAGSTWRQWPPI